MHRRLFSLVARVVRWILRQEIGVLLAAMIAASALWLFIGVADEVLEGESGQIDRRILLAFRDPDDLSRPIGPAWVVMGAEELTALGSASVLTLVSASVVGFLLLTGSRRSAAFVVIAVGGGALLSTALKYAFGRDRPDVVPHLTHFASPSFPSGHAMLSTVTYLTLGALVAQIQERKRERAYVVGLAIGVAALVGFTRVYLGVHNPSDVLAGWAGGVAWAVGCWGVARWMRLRAGHVQRAAHD